METRPRLLDLCSGIGGFSLAASWLGIETIGFCEIDPWCQRVLAKNFPGVPIHDDLRTLTGTIVHGWLGRNQDEIAAYADRQSQPEQSVDARSRRGFVVSRGLDLITAGYPCQPFSHAGKRLGTEDDRHLWPHIARLVAELRPRYCLFENVAGHISLGLDDVLSDLEALNYACWPVVVPACAVNAPHRRDRVWIVAHAGGSERRAGNSKGCDSHWQDRLRGERAQGAGGASERCEVLADAAASRLQERNGLRPHGEPTLAATPASLGRQTLSGLGLSLDGLPGFLAGPLNAWDGDWEAGVSRTTDKEPDRVNKLKALGNAVVPQIPYILMLAMLEADYDAA